MKGILPLIMISVILLLTSCPYGLTTPAITHVLVFDPTEEFNGNERLFHFLKDNGFIMIFHREWYVDANDLRNYKIVFMYDYSIPGVLPNKTLQELLKYVENGGGLILIHSMGKPSKFTHILNITVTGYYLFDEKNKLEYWNDIFIPTYKVFISDEFSYKVSRIVVPKSIALSPNKPSFPIVIINNETLAYDPKTGKIFPGNFTPITGTVYSEGRIVLFGSEDMFYDFYIYSEDNAQFLLNVFCWVSKTSLREASYNYIINLTYAYEGVAIFIIVIGTLLVAFSNKIIRRVSRSLVLVYLSLNTIMCLSASLYYIASTYSPSLEWTLISWLVIPPLLMFACLIFFFIKWKDLNERLRTSMSKLMISISIAYGLATAYYTHFRYYNPPSLYFKLDPEFTKKTVITGIALYACVVAPLWIGIPTLWLLFRKAFERNFVYPGVIELNLPPEAYEDIFYDKLYGNYIFKIIAATIAAKAIPGVALHIYSYLWGGRTLPEEWYHLIILNSFLVFSVLAAIFMLKRAVEYGLTDSKRLMEFRDLIFVRELPYILLMMFAVPALISSVIYMKVESRLALSLVGLFVSFIVGYIAVRLCSSNLSSVTSTILITVIFLVYQWLINSAFLKPILGFIPKTSLSGIMSVVLTVAFKKVYSDFEKALQNALKRKKVLPTPPPPPPPPPK